MTVPTILQGSFTVLLRHGQAAKALAMTVGTRATHVWRCRQQAGGVHFLQERRSGGRSDLVLNETGKEQKAEVGKHDHNRIGTKLTMLDLREMQNHPQVFA